jgi:hypothetical protein
MFQIKIVSSIIKLTIPNDNSRTVVSLEALSFFFGFGGNEALGTARPQSPFAVKKRVESLFQSSVSP